MNAVQRPEKDEVYGAIRHALWEASQAMSRPWMFCACVAMLRKTVDIWSKYFRDELGITFNKGERDDLKTRLQKIAEANKLYRETIGTVIDRLRIDANEALHDVNTCVGGRGGTWDGPAIVAIEAPYRELWSLVMNLLSGTMPGLLTIGAPPGGGKRRQIDLTK